MTTAQQTIFLVYLAVGPLCCAAMLLLICAGRRRMMLFKQLESLPDPAPLVSLIIPAKDEAAGIRQCIESVLQQDYPNFEVLAVNDRSDDETGQILDELAAQEPRLRVLHIPPDGLPEGWTGKNHALHRAWPITQGEWIFFVDSDVTLAPQTLSQMMTLATARGYDLLSLMTRLECHSAWERIILPVAAGAVSFMYTISMTNNDSRPAVAFANGQCMLVRKCAYAEVGGQEAVKDLITEDVELARLLKKRGKKVRLALGAHLASTRMYSRMSQMFRGWGRIYSGLSRRRPWRIVLSIGVVLISFFSVYPVLAWGVYDAIEHQSWRWLIAAAIHWIALTLMLSLLYAWSGNPRRNALLFPYTGAMLLALYIFALKWCATGKVEWRGTQYAPMS